jgi:excinuclease ABC subunit A
VPLHRLVAVTGVSGSGKSTLARDVLLANLPSVVPLRKPPSRWAGCDGVEGQPRWTACWKSTRRRSARRRARARRPTSASGTPIRKLFAETLEAKARGYAPSRFSFNTGAGRCPGCEGQGMKTIEMSFLPDVKSALRPVPRPALQPGTLAVTWRGKSIGDVLTMEVDEAVEFFASMPSDRAPAAVVEGRRAGLPDAGPAVTDAVGRRGAAHQAGDELVKVRDDVTRRGQKAPHTLYVLDEPTVGLHMADVEQADPRAAPAGGGGHSVIVIEHDLDVIAEADWVLDLGPEGGTAGGRVVIEGTPEQVVASGSHTGVALKPVLSRVA